MNNKGFTTIELILTMSIVIVIMTTITSVTHTYRDRNKYEEVVSELNNYKNNVTKIINDDILNVRGSVEVTKGRVVKITRINNNSYQLITDTNEYYTLNMIDQNATLDGKTVHEVGIEYDGTKYLVPGYTTSSVVLDRVALLPYDTADETNFYVLDIYFTNTTFNYPFKIHLIVSKE